MPGFRFFKCDECGSEWKSESRDCYSPSGECCLNQDCESMMNGALTSPHNYEEHPEWPTDGSGNLIPGTDYENYKEENYDSRNS